MPLYDVTAVAHAIDIDPKQLDNLLSRNALLGIEKQKRGIARRLTPDLVVTIRIAKELAEAFGLAIGSLFSLAQQIVQEDREALPVGQFATLTIELRALRAETLQRLNAAVEVVGRRPRGRPPTRSAARLDA